MSVLPVFQTSARVKYWTEWVTLLPFGCIVIILAYIVIRNITGKAVVPDDKNTASKNGSENDSRNSSANQSVTAPQTRYEHSTKKSVVPTPIIVAVVIHFTGALFYLFVYGIMEMIAELTTHGIVCHVRDAGIGIAFYTVTKVSMYFFYIFRVQYSFDESSLKYSESKLRFFRIAIIFIGVTWIIFVNIFALEHTCNTPLWVVIYVGITDSGISFVCLYLFIRPFRQLMLSASQARNNVKFRELIIKHSILAFWTMFTTSLIAGFGGFVLTDLGNLFVSIDIFCNAFCVFLSFSFNTRHFDRFCGCLSKRMQSLIPDENEQKRHMDRAMSRSMTNENGVEV